MTKRLGALLLILVISVGSLFYLQVPSRLCQQISEYRAIFIHNYLMGSGKLNTGKPIAFLQFVNRLHMCKTVKSEIDKITTHSLPMSVLPTAQTSTPQWIVEAAKDVKRRHDFTEQKPPVSPHGNDGTFTRDDVVAATLAEGLWTARGKDQSGAKALQKIVLQNADSTGTGQAWIIDQDDWNAPTTGCPIPGDNFHTLLRVRFEMNIKTGVINIKTFCSDWIE